jgi:hypothetical protein
MPRLSDEDSRAVDMLLESPVSGGARKGDGGSLSAFPPAFAQRLASVEKLFQMLDELPASEPSPALLARTMKIAQSNAFSDVPPMMDAPGTPLIPPSQPMA